MRKEDSCPLLRLAWWSPWPPARSGVAEYSLSLVEQLRRLAQVEVFVADDRAGRTVLSFDDVPVRPASDFWTQHARKAFDAAIFHLGNQAGHAYMADALVRTPCKRVAVLHDGSLYHLYEGVSRWRLLREISAEEGWAAAWRAWRRMLLPGSDSYNHPLLRRICCASDLLIAHSAFLAERLRAVTKNRVELVPYGATPFIDDGGQLQAHARRALSLPTDAVLFGVFGYVTAAKRVEQVIEAFTMSSLQQSWLYIAGEVGLLTPLAVRRWADDPARCARHRIRFEPAYRTPLYVLLAMQAVDVGIVLRFPTTGETSAVLSDLLSMGKPVIVSDVGAFREVPDECAIKVLVSKDEVADLVTAMRRLAFEPGLRAHMASAARMYSAQQTWSTVARIYHRIVAQVCAQ
ncbi:MAG: hypothetical protein RML99_08235 [Anaerolineae bacterium]|nr:hypothetical protein [Anaerolineae bacterium]